MSVVEISGGKLDRRYLARKSKDELIMLILDSMALEDQIRAQVIDEIKNGLDLEVVIISDDLGNNGYRCEDVDALIKRVEAKP